jgi:hypothetical protein
MTRSLSNFPIYLVILTCLFASNCASVNTFNSLPDNYLPIKLKRSANKFESSSKYLEGFLFAIVLPEDFNKKEVTKDIFFSLVKDKKITGSLIINNGKSTPIGFEIVQFRNQDDVYMKTAYNIDNARNATLDTRNSVLLCHLSRAPRAIFLYYFIA